jgi:hypothetical protein
MVVWFLCRLRSSSVMSEENNNPIENQDFPQPMRRFEQGY